MDLDKRRVALACDCGARGAAVLDAAETQGMVLELAGPFTRRDGGGARCLLCGGVDAIIMPDDAPKRPLGGPPQVTAS